MKTLPELKQIEDIYAQILKDVEWLHNSQFTAITASPKYEPLNGWDTPIYPPTYDGGAHDQHNGSNGQRIFTLASFQGRANHMELGLLDNIKRGGLIAPLMTIKGKVLSEQTCYDLPHRIYEYQFFTSRCKDKTIFKDSPLGKELYQDSLPKAILAMVRCVPNQFIYGGWGSGLLLPNRYQQTNGHQIGRMVSSIIEAAAVRQEDKLDNFNRLIPNYVTNRSSSRIDPHCPTNARKLFLRVKGDPHMTTEDPKSKDYIDLSNTGKAGSKVSKFTNTQQPATLKYLGICPVEGQIIERFAINYALSFNYNCQHKDDEHMDAKVRAMLICLALTGHRLSIVKTLHLRTNCDLLLVDDFQYYFRGVGKQQPFSLTCPDAIKLYHFAAAQIQDKSIYNQAFREELSYAEDFEETIVNTRHERHQKKLSGKEDENGGSN